jgi:GTPase
MEDSFVFEMLDSFDGLEDRAPTQWVTRYVPPPQRKPNLRFVIQGTLFNVLIFQKSPKMVSKQSSNLVLLFCRHEDATQKSKHKRRICRRKKRVDMFNTDTTDELNLPPFLRRYGVQIKNPWEFSGPSVLKEESDEGCVEYKLRLSRGNPTRFQQLVTQLKYRIAQGGGQCFYCLGVEDNGHPAGLDSCTLAESIATLEAMASEVDATATVIRTPPGTEGRLCAFICVRRGAAGSASDLTEVRIAVAGAVDGGKSTLISVLSHGTDGQPTLDNGRGAARMAILRHKHEIESGRTSSVSHITLAYSPTGAVLNYSRVAQFTPRELVAFARKFVRFSDLGGHQRYSKTSLHGLTSTRPDYTMLCICASQGLSWVALDHLAVSLALQVPVVVVITKVDAVQRSTVEEVVEEIFKVANKACVKGGVEVENVDQAIQIAKTVSSQNSTSDNSTVALFTQPVLPVFCVSCVTGARLPALHAFLNALPSSASSPASYSPTTSTTPCGIPDIQNKNATIDELVSNNPLSVPHPPPPPSSIPTHFQVDGSMDIAGVGPVFSGVVISGSISIGDEVLVGPDDDGLFRNVVVSGLHRAQVEVETVRENQNATVAVSMVASSWCQGARGEDGLISRKSSSSVREYEGEEEEDEEEEDEEEEEELGTSVFSSERDRGVAASPGVKEGVCCDGDLPVVASASAAAGRSPSMCLPQKFKRQTSQADIELLGKSWDFVRHLTTPGNPSTIPTTATAAVGTIAATGGAATSTSSSSADLTPSEDQVDQVYVAPPLRPRKGTVLLGYSSSTSTSTRNRNNTADGAQAQTGDVSGCLYFEAVVAMIDQSESVWPSKKEMEKQRDKTNTRSTGAHQVMVHCGGVRQAAGMIAIEYSKTGGAGGVGEFHDDTLLENEWARTVSGAKAAATVLQHAITKKNNHVSLSCDEDEDRGVKTARVKFEFLHRPEWLLPGSRVIFRDAGSGKVVGAGLILTGQKD